MLIEKGSVLLLKTLSAVMFALPLDVSNDFVQLGLGFIQKSLRRSRDAIVG